MVWNIFILVGAILIAIGTYFSNAERSNIEAKNKALGEEIKRKAGIIEQLALDNKDEQTFQRNMMTGGDSFSHATVIRSGDRDSVLVHVKNYGDFPLRNLEVRTCEFSDGAELFRRTGQQNDKVAKCSTFSVPYLKPQGSEEVFTMKMPDHGHVALNIWMNSFSSIVFQSLEFESFDKERSNKIRDETTINGELQDNQKLGKLLMKLQGFGKTEK